MTNLINFNEEWKLIAEFPCYEISNLGHVRHARIKKTLKPWLNAQGYPKLTLSLGGRQRAVRSVHRLMAITFIPNPLSKPQVNHIDRDKTNFQIANLEWVTPLENSRHAHSHKPKIVKSFEKKVVRTHRIRYAFSYLVYRGGVFKGSFKTREDVSELIGIAKACVSQYVRNGRVTKRGYSVERLKEIIKPKIENPSIVDFNNCSKCLYHGVSIVSRGIGFNIEQNIFATLLQ